jgi:hypothetical protein
MKEAKESGDEVMVTFEKVPFKDGSASKAWKDGTVEEN